MVKPPLFSEDCPPIARGRANELTASVQQMLREGTGQAEAQGVSSAGRKRLGAMGIHVPFELGNQRM